MLYFQSFLIIYDHIFIISQSLSSMHYSRLLRCKCLWEEQFFHTFHALKAWPSESVCWSVIPRIDSYYVCSIFSMLLVIFSFSGAIGSGSFGLSFAISSCLWCICRLCYLLLLASLLFFMLDDPVKVVQHVCIGGLEADIFLNFDL